MNAGGHEPDQTDTVALFKLSALFGVLLALILAGMYLLWLRVHPHYLPIPARDVPPTPRLQAVPPLDRIALYRTQRQQLDSYGWVNKQGGIAHIPIERAMALVAAQKTAQPASPRQGEISR